MKYLFWPIKLLKGFPLCIKLFTRLSFRKKITISLLILSFVMILYMGISSYQLSSNIILDMSKKLSENNFEVVYKSLDNYFRSVEKNSTLLLRMSDLRAILLKNYYDNSGQFADKQRLDASVREIINLASSNDKITFNTVSIYCKNGFSYNYFQESTYPYNDYKSCINYYISNEYINTGYKSSTWCDVIETYNKFGRKSHSFINLRILYDPVDLEEIGIMVTGVDEDDLHKIYSGFSDKAYIMHKNGRIISHYDKAVLGTALNNDTIYKKINESYKSIDTLNNKAGSTTQLITFKKLAANNAYFVVPFDYYNGLEVIVSESFNLNIIILILIGIITSIIFALLLSKGLSASVLSLKKTVQEVYEGNLNARFKSENNDEVSYLGNKFNEMLVEINSLFSAQKEQENINRTLELKLMQSQINPHLLYNTLDSALWEMDNKNISQAKDLIISLSSFFKITLSEGNDLIPLQKELELISNYIGIQNSARGKNIIFNVDAPLPLLSFKIIKLTIQPIVENAILHGFSGYRDDGTITIRIATVAADAAASVAVVVADIDKKESVQITNKKALAQGNTLNGRKEAIQIIIEDNGIGIPDKELAIIKQTLEVYPPEAEIKHFGLYNVQRRIKNLFGNNYGINLESEVGNYTRVFMCIPVINR